MNKLARLWIIAALVGLGHVVVLGGVYLHFRPATPAASPATEPEDNLAPGVDQSVAAPQNPPTQAPRARESVMPPQRMHQVIAGDSYWQLAKNYGVSMEAILAYNQHSRNRTLKVGEIIKIPDH